MSKVTYTFSISFIVFLAAFHPANAGPNDPVNIPDANLRAILEQALGKTSGDPITETEMASFTGNQGTQLSVSSNVSDLTGLQYATGVRSMLFGHFSNTITDLSPLADLTQLERLTVFHTGGLTDISPLKKLTALTELTIQKLRPSATASFSDISVLASLTQLKILFLNYNEIVDLSPLRALTTLTNLTLTGNKIVDISPLVGLTALVQLHLASNKIRDISPLRGLTDLEELYLSANTELSDISPLMRLKKLKRLQLDQTAITVAGLSGVLPALGALKGLSLKITRISALSVLDRLPTGATLASLDLRYIGSLGRDVAWLLTDITPLVRFVQAGKMGPDSSFSGSPRIELEWNLGLDYESIYTDLPVLINSLSGGSVKYHNSQPALEAEDQVGHPGARHTFVVRAVNTTRGYKNPRFAKVPVTFTVTNPDGTTETQGPVLTGSNGLASVSFRLGTHGETHTVDAVVPENTPISGKIEHPELRVRFTVTADSTVPQPRGPGHPDEIIVTFLGYPQETPIDEFSLTIEFSEPVIGFEKEDITVQTALATGSGDGILMALTPETRVDPDRPEPNPMRRCIATIALPSQATGTVRLIVDKDAATTPATAIMEKTGPSSNTASEFIAFGGALDEDARFRHPPALVVTQIDFAKGMFWIQNTTQYRFNVEMRIYSEDHRDRWFSVSERALIPIKDAETLAFSLTPVATDDPSIIHLNSERLLNQNQNQPLKLSSQKFCIKLMRGITVDTVSNMNEDFRFKGTRWNTPGDVIYRQYDASWDAKLKGLRRDHLPYYRFPLAGQLSDSWGVEASVPAGPPVSVDLPASTLPETSTLGSTLSILPASVVSPPIGEQLVLNLNIEGGESVAGYQTSVQFDTTALRYASSANGDYLPSGAVFVAPVVEGNLVKLNAASPVGEAHGNGTLATLTFEVIAVKASTLTLVDVLLSNAAGAAFVPQLENAQITKPPGPKGDVNGDGTVNTADLVLIASNFGKTGQKRC